jgi:hypothetical protein
MPVGRSVQFRGVEQVVGAYKSNNIPAYAVCYEKNINFRYVGRSMKEGADLLEAYLDLLSQNESAAHYTLRLYEDLKGKIKNSTAWDMSFNFMVNEKSEESVAGMGMVQSGNSGEIIKLLREMSDIKMQNALNELKLKQIEEAAEEEEENDPVKPMGAQVMEQLVPLIGKIGGLLGEKLFGGGGDVSMAGVTVTADDEMDEKIIQDSLTRLENGLPPQYPLPAVLAKLADMCENETDQFIFYLGVLMK